LLGIAFARYWGDVGGHAIAAGSVVVAVLWPEFWAPNPALDDLSSGDAASSVPGSKRPFLDSVEPASAELVSATLPLSSPVVEEGTVVGASLPAALPTAPADPSVDRPRPPEVLE